MTAPSAPPKTAPSAVGRIVGIDLARLVAIVGMMAAHLIAPLGSDSGASSVDQALGKVIGATVSSTSATTFAVLGGVSLVLLTRGMRDASTGRMLLSILLRGILIALIGTLLLPLDGPISVVLTYYGAAMIIAAPALLLPSWGIAIVVTVLWLFGGAFNAHVRAALAASLQAPGADAGAEIGGAVRDLLLTGHYPAITWVAYMLTGILIARMLLAARAGGGLRALCSRLAIGGLAVYLLITLAGRIVRMRPAWFSLPDLGEMMLSSGFGAPIGTDLWMLLIPTPHSGNPADMLRTVAGACFVVGLLVGIFDARSRSRGIALQTVRAAGAAPLTVYTAHVVATATLYNLAMAGTDGTGTPWYARGTAVFLVQLAGVLLIGLVLALLRRRGPLEALLGWLSGSSRARSTSAAVLP
ncbi:heparan-alpha-glucosaminide N-acetyltransferase domain-containing protein [Microbacterium sp.]|uniref:heparan-alpha-glucosaminide N-acetyltransferase domain-containing protein n=1 Tax=Microbacterium sp. TaxID=51671 RepID=UPI002811245D|nr:heparan-alpha-glucosaminide N-acetyltransferase domain-containing protein [Microbacterium sp.]